MPGTDSAEIGATDLASASALMGQRTMELSARSYHPELIARGTSRAFGIAEARTRGLSASIRGQAFLELLVVELNRCDNWMDKQLSYFETL